MDASTPDSTVPQSYRRSPQALQTLSHEARVWLLGLPAEVRPLQLARAYARIVNRLATVWTRPSGADQYLYSLVNDTRGGRRGFPQPIPQELRRLQAYYEAEIAPNLLPAERPTLNRGSPSWDYGGGAVPPARGERERTMLSAERPSEDLEQWIADWLGSHSKAR